MIYGPAFYKLLGIPESVVEPTAYHLLAIDPRMVTGHLVDEALAAQKLRVRHNIPGPQFIPVVAAIERELDAAAEILRDPHRRYEYNERLLGRAKAHKDELKVEQRCKIVAECRAIVRSMVGPDGMVPLNRRDELAGRLRGAGMAGQDVRYILEHIPSPSGAVFERHGPAEHGQTGLTGAPAHPAGTGDRHRGREPAEVMAFFLAAVDMEVRGGLLSGADERKLVTLAQRLGMDAGAARSAIDDRLSALGAARGERDESSLVAQFKLRLLAMFPMADATEMDRKRLLSLAAAEGLSVAAASKVIDDYIRPSAGGDAAAGHELARRLGEDRAAGPASGHGGVQAAGAVGVASVARSAAAEQEPSAPLLGQGPARQGWWGGLLVAGIVVGMSLLAAAALWPQFARRWSRVGADGNSLVAGASGTGGVEANNTPAAAPSEPRRPLVLDAAFAALADPDKVRGLLDKTGSEDRTAAFGAVARIMVLGGTPRETVSAEMLLKIVLGCPPASPACQDAAVTALIGRLAAARGALDANSSVRGAWRIGGQARKALGLLAGAVLLREAAPQDANDPDEVLLLLDRCWRTWRESVAAAPTDPVNDPKRLAYAVVDGGSLDIYAERADAARFGPLAAELAAMACDPNRPGSDKAQAALHSAAAKATFQPALGNIVRLALADAAGAAADAAQAGRAVATLADAMGLAQGHALRAMPLDSPLRRRQAAEAMREVIRAGAAAQTAPATRPDQAAAPGAINAALAFAVRRTWSGKYADEALLADMTTTMLACAARAERLALHTDSLDRELSAVLSQRDQAARTARLTRDVVLTDGVVAAVIDSTLGLDPNTADALRKGLRSLDSGERLQAIDVLQRLGGPPAGELLMERLDELARSGNSGDITVINRILLALAKIDDPRVPGRLAALIEPARTNAVANGIVMTLLDGTGLAGSTDRENYLLPISHTAAQRKAAAAQWQAAAKSVGWGPGQMDRAIGAKKVPQVAWLPDGQTEKLLAAFVYYADITGRMLRNFKPAGQAGPTTAPDARPALAAPVAGAAKIPAPVTSDELAVAAEAMANELARLARAADAAGKFTAQLDAVEDDAMARLAASKTALQAAAVRLDQAGWVLEVLVRQADGRPEIDAALSSLRLAHEKVIAATTNVLDELRELAFHDLVLLEQLGPAKP